MCYKCEDIDDGIQLQSFAALIEIRKWKMRIIGIYSSHGEAIAISTL
jgi:hypothetical protein